MIVGEDEGEPPVEIGTGVTEVPGDECSGVVGTHDGDHPLAAEGIVRRQGNTTDARDRRQGKTRAECGDDWATGAESGVPACGAGGEVPGLLKGTEDDRRCLEGESLVFKML